MGKEIPIIRVESTSVPIYKGLFDTQERFILPVTYHLADGQTIPACIARRRKKDVMPGLEHAQQYARSKAMFACFNDAGEYWGTMQKCTIGGGGLEPANPEQEVAA